MIATASNTATVVYINWLPLIIIGLIAVVLIAGIATFATLYLGRTIITAIGGIQTAIDARFSAVEDKLNSGVTSGNSL